ncbi:hypothetical protein ABVT39_001713 [Epinephelus coioides]
MSASGLPSLWRLWTILGCAAAIHRRSPGSWLMANTDTPGYSTVISVPLRSSHHISTPSDQLQLPHRPRYIHRGSGRRFVLSKHGDHGNPHRFITSLWSAGRTVAQQWRHQNTATPVAKDRSAYGRMDRKPGVDHSVLRPLNGLDSAGHSTLELLNVQSLTNKAGLINDHITDKGINILCLTETWQQPEVYSVLNEACPPEYGYLSKARTTGWGGGLAVFHRSTIQTSLLSVPPVNTFEHLVFNCKHITSHHITSATIALIYRPPKPHPSFLSEIHDFLISLCTSHSNILVLGDFNIHMDSLSCQLAVEFKQVLDCLNLHQSVVGPTHTKGHTLDLVITDSIHISDLHVQDIGISDHYAVTFRTPHPSPLTKPQRLISFRNFKNIDSTSLNQHLQLLSPPSNTSLTDLMDYYNHNLHSILDFHAPLKTRTVTFTRSAPWFTEELRLLKRTG